MMKGEKKLAKRGMTSHLEEQTTYWLMVLPGFLIYFAVMAFPTVFSVILSLSNYNGGPVFNNARHPFKMVGFDAYAKIFKDEYFYVALKNNFLIVLVSIFGQIPLGFMLAYILERGMVKFKDFFQTMIYLPTVISTVVIGILWKSFFSPTGAFPELMKMINPAYESTVST